MNAESLNKQYGLQAHPEGGWFKETYRADGLFKCPEHGNIFPCGRSYGTAIYFLLCGADYSAFHKIKSDEIWHFYAGCTLKIYFLDHKGDLVTIRLGNEVEGGTVFQAIVPAGCWFAAEPEHKDAYSFVGCTVAPGFDFRDFELARREELQTVYPQHAGLISSLTRI
jgi:predicted cupin superfamily sugar epimerase